jgi:tetratricopeptide (TPR) repeat protein
LVIENYRGITLKENNQVAGSTIAHEEARLLGDELLRAGAGDVREAVAVGNNLINLGGNLRLAGRCAESAEQFQKAVELLSPQIDMHPRHYPLRRSLALAYSGWCGTWEQSGQREQAAEAAHMAIELLEELVAEVPANPQYLESLLVAYSRRCTLLLYLDRPEEALLVNDETLQRLDGGLKNTLKGQAEIVSAYWRRSDVLVKLKRLDEAATTAQKAVDLATGYFGDLPDYARGQYQLMYAWAQLINLLSLQNEAGRLVEIMPQFYAVVENYNRLNPGADQVAGNNDYLAWAIRLEALNLARLSRWEEAVSAAGRILQVSKLTGAEHRPRYEEAALGLAQVLNAWSEAETSPGPEYEMAQLQGLAWLESEIREYGFNRRIYLERNGAWQSLRQHPRFDEVVGMIKK